jgi:hypothetical protein
MPEKLLNEGAESIYKLPLFGDLISITLALFWEIGSMEVSDRRQIAFSSPKTDLS